MAGVSHGCTQSIDDDQPAQGCVELQIEPFLIRSGLHHFRATMQDRRSSLRTSHPCECFVSGVGK